jgi:hypothetical protein
MRYCVRYRTQDKHWVVADTGTRNQVLGVHETKSEAYRQALTLHEHGSTGDPEAEHLKRVRAEMPRTLVIERFKKDVALP